MFADSRNLRRLNLFLASMAVLAPLAHVLEMANKLALDGPMWLAVQQHLYRGWGPFLGAPTEIGSLLTSFCLLLARQKDRSTRRLTAIAAMLYAGMIATFFIFNSPVNTMINQWDATTLSGNWQDYRLRWESGHAIAAALGVTALVFLVHAYLKETDRL